MTELMLCETGSKRDLDDPRYGAELKADGTHIRIRKLDETFGIYGRPNRRTGEIPDYTLRLPEVIEAAEVIPAGSFELVGEVVVFDDAGRTWFEGSQRRCSTQSASKIPLIKLRYPVILLTFDMTELDGKNIERYGWEERKSLLKSLVDETPQDTILYLPHFVEDKRSFFEQVVVRGEEGVILKMLGSPYVRKRSRYWLKVKHWIPARTLVVGYTEGTGRRRDWFGSLILAQTDDIGHLRYVGKVGTGFNDQELEKITKLLSNAGVESPLVDAREPKTNKRIEHTPVEIALEVSVKYFEVSKNGVFRFPSLLKDDSGRNIIHYGGQTISGKPRQTDLKSMLESLTR